MGRWMKPTCCPHSIARCGASNRGGERRLAADPRPRGDADGDGGTASPAALSSIAPTRFLGLENGPQGTATLQVPNEVNGRAGQATALLTTTSAELFEEPAVVLSAEPLLRK